MTLCKTCPFRAACKDPCRALLQHLAPLEGELKEEPADPEILEQMLTYEAALESGNRAQLYVELAEVIPDLTPMQRRCVELYFLRALSPTEIAKLIGLTRSSVRTHLKRAAQVFPKRSELTRFLEQEDAA